MIFEEKKITLKDGREAILKTPEIADAEAMLNYIKTACGETDFLLRYPEEWDGATVESEAKWVESVRNNPNNIAITCYVDGRVAGNCEIGFKTNMKSAHRATVAIAVLREFWVLGIGSAFFTEMIAAAEARGTEIIELEYLEGNERAVKLYEKFGFETVSYRPNATKLRDGTYLKEFYMQKYLK